MKRRNQTPNALREWLLEATVYRIEERFGMHRIDAGAFKAGFEGVKRKTFEAVLQNRLGCGRYHVPKNTDPWPTDKPIPDILPLSYPLALFVLACTDKNSTLKKIYAKTYRH